jgi:threonine synthase
MTTLTHLECGLCGKAHEAGKAASRCGCGGVLLVRYDLENARRGWSREWLGNSPPTMWRYAPMLPVGNPQAIVSLGEGMTPLSRTRRLGLANLWIKDDGVSPTGSSEARCFSVIASMALELGFRKLSATTGGNAGAALAAYAAAAGLEARISLPRDSPRAAFVACRACGADVRVGSAWPAGDDWIDVAAFAEPYRIEGMKTLGYEIAEQSRWELPDTIVCPGGDGAIPTGISKAFEELEAIGWISKKRPRMVAVESGDGQLAGVAVGRQEMLGAGIEMASAEGIFAGLEGAACLAALRKMISEGSVKSDETIVLVNPGSGHLSAETYATRFPRSAATEQDKLGGLITPR